MDVLLERLLQISLSTAVVIGILLLLIPMLRERYSARWRKVIWLVIAVRLLVPFSVELPSAPVQMDMDLQQVVAMNTTPVLVDTTANQNTVTDDAMVPAGVTSPSAELSPVGVETGSAIIWNRGMILFAVWLIGMIAFILWHAAQYIMFRRKVMMWMQPLDDSDELLQRAGEDMQLKHYPDAAVSSFAQGPMLVGFTKPVIILPNRIYGEQELLLILRHELMHYKQHDLWYKLVLLAANAVHWFNPLVWLMLRQANKDIEQVCDDNVVAGKDMDYRKAYSMTLLNAMASQRGVALSTYLSKDAQNAKRRFADILQPKQYKKGIAVLCAVVLLAVGISGCLQIGNNYNGEKIYERVAPFLPENAIHAPSVYQIWSEDDDIEYVTYEWKEDIIPEMTQFYEDSEIKVGWKYEDKKIFKRGLMVMVSKEDGRIISLVYDGDENTVSSVKAAEIGRDETARNNYINRVVDAWAGKDFDDSFRLFNSETDEDGNLVCAEYTFGTIADTENCYMKLNCQVGYVEEFQYHNPYTTGIWGQRSETIMIEGLEETVELQLNRQPDYYAMYTDPTMFSSRLSGVAKDGSFCDEYTLIDETESALIKSYMRVGFTPDCTIDEWLELVQTNGGYVQYAPQINPLSSSWPRPWTNLNEKAVFNDDPVRQWKVFRSIRDGAINYCYLTPYRDGVMAAIISYPSSSEYTEGIGVRMHAMLNTLVLASRGDTPQNSLLESVVLSQKADDYTPAQQQVINWLAVQNTQLYDDFYNILGYRVDGLWDEQKGDTHSISLFLVSLEQYAGDRDTNTFLNELKESGSEDYQYFYESFYDVREGTQVLRVEADMQADGLLNLENCKLYTEDIEGGWNEISNLSPLVGNMVNDRSRWTKDAVLAATAADGYLQGFIQRDKEVMRLYSTAVSVVYPNNQQYWNSEEQTMRQTVINQIDNRYDMGSQINADTTVQLTIQLEAQEGSTQYLTMQLQKVDSTWKVTAAQLTE